MSTPQETARPDQIREWLETLLLFEDGQVELRAVGVPGKKNGVVAKLYRRSDLASLVDQAVDLSGRAEAVYFTLNPVRAESKRSAFDKDIDRRTLLLVDCDPTRDPEARRLAGDGAKLSATDMEKFQANVLSMQVTNYLRRLGWPEPVRADSGNGIHLLYAIELPNDDDSRELVRGVLRSLARFDTADAAVDTSVFNAGRICKLYGTMSRKGVATAERPHRASSILAIPERFRWDTVSREMLEAVAALAPRPETTPAPAAPAPVPTERPRPAAGREWSAEDRAVAYLAKCDPAVSGNKGHNKAFGTACKVGPGFDLGPDVTFRLLRDHWNPTCQPPWSEKDLRRKVDEAYKKEPNRGFLLNADRASGPPSRPRPPAADGTGGPDEPPTDSRPRILVSTDEMWVNDQAIRALASDPRLFCRGQDLVTIRRERRKNRLVNRPDESPWIAVMPRSTLRELMSRAARWEKTRCIPRTNMVEDIPAHPPEWSVAAVAERGDWGALRHLEGIVEAPSLLADGTILDTPGYDERSGLVYEPGCDFPPIPREIGREDARAAADELLQVVADFPFAHIGGDGGAGHRAAWLASLLTPLARHAIDGPCPLFLIDANVSGAGKTKLVDIVAILTTGRTAPRTAMPEHDEEMRKVILSIALEGDRLVLIDNVATGADLGGASLDGVLTGTSVKGRILGRSEMSREVPIHTVWYATGNNLGLKGDLLRRVVPFRIESPHERPEERTDFRIQGDLLQHVRDNRGRLVVAALTILRGYYLAGRPTAELVPMDYPAWCGVVRQAIHWATGVDPCSTRRELIAENPEAHQARAIIAGWAELPGGGTGLTTAEALRILQDPELQQRYGTIRDVLAEMTRDGKLPSPRVIGKQLKAIEDRVIDGMVMRGRPYQGTKHWAAYEASDADSRGSGGFRGSVSPHAGELLPGFDAPNGVHIFPQRSQSTPTKPTTPTDSDRGDAFEGDLPAAADVAGPGSEGGGA